MAKSITAGVRAQILRNLQATYPSVTREYLDPKIDALIAGEKPTEIMGMLAQSMLRQAGYLD